MFPGLVLCVAAFVQIAVQVAFLFAGKNRGVLGEHEFEIRDYGLVERTKFNESLHHRSGIQKLKSTREFLFIYVGDNLALCIPQRRFESNQTADNFRAEITRRFKDAQR